jgi:hypothetical protein
MPGHWVLARAGKRVLRPGGLELTERMLGSLAIGPSDDVVELAPGLGLTARRTIGARPASFTAVERDHDAASLVRGYLEGHRQRCVVGDAADTGLPDGMATVVYGEAMLTMQTAETKRAIVSEARRMLRPGGRYAVHELCLVPDDVDADVRRDVEATLAAAVRVGVRPLTIAEWRRLLESEGFVITSEAVAPMHLLEPGRVVRDEGLAGALRFLFNVLTHAEIRRRVLAMRSGFRRHRAHLAAVTITAVKG